MVAADGIRLDRQTDLAVDIVSGRLMKAQIDPATDLAAGIQIQSREWAIPRCQAR